MKRVRCPICKGKMNKVWCSFDEYTCQNCKKIFRPKKELIDHQIARDIAELDDIIVNNFHYVRVSDVYDVIKKHIKRGDIR